MTERFAEYTRRPLLALNAFDNATELRAAESRLKKSIALAEHLGALLLLENAECYLSRESKDLGSINIMACTSFSGS